MKYWKHICAISALILLVAAGCLYLVLYKEGIRTDTKEEEIPGKDAGMLQTYTVFPVDAQRELYERMHNFAQILYQYDTAERKFFEGAEEYMTQAAYRAFYPGSAQEEDAPGAVRVQSSLLEANIYAFYESETEADVILESRFSLTQGTNGSLTQYLKLSLEKQDGQWLITECSIIDTLEE